MSLNEIAERLAIGKTTVWYWIKDLPIPKSEFTWLPPKAAARRKGNRAMQEKYEVLRREAYFQGILEYEELIAQPGFRDFLCLYVGDGYKRSKNTVSIANSDPRVMRLANHWIRKLTKGKIVYSVQYHADQDPEYLRRFWSFGLGFDPERFRYMRKSNSNQLKGRTWRSKWGVLTITTYDTMFRMRLQAWLDQLYEGWVDSTAAGA